MLAAGWRTRRHDDDDLTGEDLTDGMDGTPPDDGSRRDGGRGWKDRNGVPAADGWRPPTPRPQG